MPKDGLKDQIGDLIRTFHVGETLKAKVIRGSFWVLMLRVFQRVLTLIRTIVLARILSPNDFGLFGVALLALSALETFSQTGFHHALIQKKHDIIPYLNTAWTVQLARGVLLAVLLYTASPFIAGFFNEPKAVALLKALGLSIILQDSRNIGVVFFQKELEFRKQFIFMFSGTLADFCVAVAAAIILKNSWALVFGLITGNLVRMIVSYIVHPYRPCLCIDLKQCKELFGFGRWVLGSNILTFLITHGDDIFLGKFLGTTTLGLYQMAYRLSNLPATEITHVISQVTYPAFSKLQDNVQGLKNAYLKIQQNIAYLAVPLSFVLIVLAPDFASIFLGERWLPMVPAMQLLTLWGLIRSLGNVTELARAVGKPKIGTFVSVIHLCCLAILIYPLTLRWGMLGTSLAVLFASFIMRIVSIFSVLRIIHCTIFEFGNRLIMPFFISFASVLPVFVLKKYWGDPSGILGFCFYLGIFCVVWVILLFTSTRLASRS